MTAQPDPFAALGLPARPDLSDEQVRAAWRAIAAATHPDRPGGEPGRLRRRLSRLRRAAHGVGTLRGIRRPDGRRPIRRPPGQDRPRQARRGCSPCGAAGPVPHPARPPLAPRAAHPGRRDPGRDRGPVRRGRPGRRRCDHRPGGVGWAYRAGGSRPATGTVSTAVAGDVRVKGRGGWFFNHLAWAGPLRAGGQAELKAARRNARPPQRARVWPPALPPHARTPVKQPPAAPAWRMARHHPAKPFPGPGMRTCQAARARQPAANPQAGRGSRDGTGTRGKPGRPERTRREFTGRYSTGRHLQLL